MIRTVMLPVAAVVLAACALTAYAADDPAAQPQASAPATELQWVWGEVIAVNPGAGTMSVKYLDYDSDLEKTIDITADAQTKFEEVKALEEIKPQDTVSIEYIQKGQANIARGITVERIEETDIGEGPVDVPEKVGTGPLAVPDQPQKAE